MANCWVKFVWPFESVIVPAANRRSWLKSRLFSGIALTVWLESFSPPVPVDSSVRDATLTAPDFETVTTIGSDSAESSSVPVYRCSTPPTTTTSVYLSAANPANRNVPSAEVVATISP
jgi:hypothetical protein